MWRELRTRSHGKGLKITVCSGGVETECLIPLFEQLCGAVDPLGSGATSFHFGGGKNFNRIKITARIGFGECGHLTQSGRRKTKHQGNRECQIQKAGSVTSNGSAEFWSIRTQKHASS